MTEIENTVEEMGQALNEADMVSQGACTSILTIATLALLALQNPSVDMETIAQAIIEIKSAASTLENDINVIAEGFGRHYIDEFESADRGRRREAFRDVVRSFVAREALGAN